MLPTLGLFLHLAGLIIGLGAVTVIDALGFLGRQSGYWTEATIRAHKVTKPLIWLGFILANIGGCIWYSPEPITQIRLIQIGFSVVLFFNALFLTFWVSPRLLQREKKGQSSELLPMSWQLSITVSFLISFVSWWSQVLLLAYNLA